MSIEKGTLYIVATPIGNLDDLSPRAASVLAQADLIAAEDTRHSRPLLQRFGIDTPLMALHEHNEREAMGRILEALENGRSVALISDAGTPLISDPGFPLVRECQHRGLRVSPVPGPSAVICALSASGLPADHFIFEGFPARTSTARRTQFESLRQESRTLVFYESGHRLLETLQDMVAVFGSERPAVLARELTKLHETLICDSLIGLCSKVEADPMQRKGEIVLIVAGAASATDAEQHAEEERILRILIEELPLKQAAALTARITGGKKNRLYQCALSWQGTPGGKE